MESDPPRDAHLPPGYDEEDPYAEVDLSTLPAWWRRNVREFREYGMRPYRPPRLADGELSPPVIDALEDEYDVDVRFRSPDPEAGEWVLVVDDEVVRRVQHDRDGGAYTVFGIDSETLRETVRDAAERSWDDGADPGPASP